MSRKVIVYGFITLLFGLVSAKAVIAANESEFVLEHQITSFSPIFAVGHEGDFTQIAGFDFTTNVSFAGSPIGTASGRVTMLNPPFNPTDTYNHAVGNMVTSIEGMGTFETTIQAVSLSSSTTLSAGDVVIAYAGSLSNGTGDLANVFGLVSGVGTSNIFTGEGNITEVMRARFEF